VDASFLCEKHGLLGDATTEGACTVYCIVTSKDTNLGMTLTPCQLTL